ncbi:uncharacterized protein [Equus przewalskii]|uniref:Uncharacterized protein isoform X1 n=1 Tax=Equus przewalskii TaxID=9798 RepID=A0ABM4MVS0_EQUPR
MAAGNVFRHTQGSLPRVKQTPLRFKSETTRFLLLYFIREEGEAVSTGVIEKSILSHGLLDPIEPWRVGSEILPKADGVPRFGSVNPRRSELKNILCITHPIMSPVLFSLSTRLAETMTKIVYNLYSVDHLVSTLTLITHKDKIL